MWCVYGDKAGSDIVGDKAGSDTIHVGDKAGSDTILLGDLSVEALTWRSHIHA